MKKFMALWVFLLNVYVPYLYSFQERTERPRAGSEGLYAQPILGNLGMRKPRSYSEDIPFSPGTGAKRTSQAQTFDCLYNRKALPSQAQKPSTIGVVSVPLYEDWLGVERKQFAAPQVKQQQFAGFQVKHNEINSLQLSSVQNNTPYAVEFWDCHKKTVVCKLLAGSKKVVDYDILDIPEPVRFDEVPFDEQAASFMDTARFKVQLYENVNRNRLPGKSNYLQIEKQESAGADQLLKFRTSYSGATELHPSSVFVFQKCNDCNLRAALREPQAPACKECVDCKWTRCKAAAVDLIFDMTEENVAQAIISASFVVSSARLVV